MINFQNERRNKNMKYILYDEEREREGDEFFIG
jgi:hypothetical protein